MKFESLFNVVVVQRDSIPLYSTPVPESRPKNRRALTVVLGMLLIIITKVNSFGLHLLLTPMLYRITLMISYQTRDFTI